MVSEAKVAANRRNAKKSTGPRSTQGKAVVAQNALKHGLRARRDVVGGEDPAEFERWHNRLLADLSPRGDGEGMIAEHIAGLSWRLRRAQRVQNEAFEYLLANELKDSLKYLPDEMTAEDEQRMLDDPEQDPRLAAGRMILKDYRYHGGTLDRLMVYERRIEQSLSKMINNLCKLRLSRQDDGQGPPYRSEPLPRTGESVKQSQATDEGVCSVPVRAYQETPYGVTTNASDCAEQSQPADAPVCETKPAEVTAAVCSVPARAYQETPRGVTTNASCCAEQSQPWIEDACPAPEAVSDVAQPPSAGITAEGGRATGTDTDEAPGAEQSQPATEGNELITPRVAPPNSFDGAVAIPPDAARPHGQTSLPVPPGESAEQSQPAYAPACGTKPTDSAPGVCSVPARACQETPCGVTTNASDCAEQNQESSRLSVVSCQQEAGEPAGNCELRAVNCAGIAAGRSHATGNCVKQSQRPRPAAVVRAVDRIKPHEVWHYHNPNRRSH